MNYATRAMHSKFIKSFGCVTTSSARATYNIPDTSEGKRETYKQASPANTESQSERQARRGEAFEKK